MKILVTGGTGYIGSRLTQRLVKDGHSVYLLVRSGTTVDGLGETAARVIVIKGADNWRDVDGALRDSKPDIVFHLASLFLANHHPEDIGPLVQSNILFGAQLVEAMTLRGVSRLVIAGTAWQHYQNADYDPVNLYAATKQAFEALLSYWTATTPLRVVCLKLSDTYGPSDPRPKLVPLLIRLAQSGESAAFSPGAQLIDMVHVDDVVEAFLGAGERTDSQKQGSKETYAISSGSPLSLQDLVKVFELVLGRPLSIEWGARPYRNREVMSVWSKGIRLPGWKPRIPLTEGLRDLVSRHV